MFDNTMNVALFVAEIDQIGGAEIAMTRLADQLYARRLEVTVVTTQGMRRWLEHSGMNDYAKQILVIRLPVWQRSERTFASTLSLQALWAFPLRLRGTQVLHVRGLTPATVSLARVARRMGIRTICTPMASGIYGDVSRFRGDLRRSTQTFDRIAAMTETMRAEVTVAGYPARRISIIPNGVDPRFFKPGDRPQSEANVVFVGQFRPEKQVEVLLQAWQDVATRYPQARLTLVGGGQYMPEYQRIAASLSIAPTFVPNTDAAGVLAQLQAGSIFVAPGISEGMSNALLEAMAVGLAPVAADTPTSGAVITPDVDGLLYAAGSPEALGAQIKRLIADEPLRRQLGFAARQTVLRHFDIERVADAYVALYGQILSETR